MFDCSVCAVMETGASSLLSVGLDGPSEEILQSYSDKFQIPYLTASAVTMKPGMLKVSFL